MAYLRILGEGHKWDNIRRPWGSEGKRSWEAAGLPYQGGIFAGIGAVILWALVMKKTRALLSHVELGCHYLVIFTNLGGNITRLFVGGKLGQAPNESPVAVSLRYNKDGEDQNSQVHGGGKTRLPSNEKGKSASTEAALTHLKKEWRWTTMGMH